MCGRGKPVQAVQLAVEPELFTEKLLRGQLHREIKSLPCFAIEMAAWEVYARNDPKRCLKTLEDLVIKKIKPMGFINFVPLLLLLLPCSGAATTVGGSAAFVHLFVS